MICLVGYRHRKKALIHFEGLDPNTWYDVDIYPHDTPRPSTPFRVLTDPNGEVVLPKQEGPMFSYRTEQD
jgi:hypothetical protein